MNNHRILIVDDDKLVTWSLTRDFEREGCQIKTVGNGESALPALREFNPDLILLDLRLPGIDGLEVLKQIRATDSEVIVIMMTAYATVETAVQAVKLGAIDFIKKPFTFDELKIIIERALRSKTLSREVANLRQHIRQKYGIHNIIGVSRQMQEVFTLIRKIAQSDATTVLITGESGTGKDLVARAIHYESRRAAWPYMAINCGSLPDTLLESELFGHEKGAFTDAKTAKKGLLELANKGTVLLDEIGDASLALQVKLLRFMEEKVFKRIGSTRDIEVDVRIIAATNRNLEQLVAERQFREDLYYRLKVIPLNLPPLRERPEDIPVLVKHFIDRFNKEFKKNVRQVSPEAMRILKLYNWPGNIRELRNLLERIMILENDETISTRHLPLELTLQADAPDEVLPDVSDISAGTSLQGMEKSLILKALQSTGGNQSRAAQLLHISRHALRYKMKKYHLLE